MRREHLIQPYMTYGQICKTIGQRVRERRERQKLSRDELAKRSGVSSATIARFELKGIATVGVMVKLALALNALDSFSALFASPKFRSIEEMVAASEEE